MNRTFKAFISFIIAGASYLLYDFSMRATPVMASSIAAEQLKDSDEAYVSALFSVDILSSYPILFVITPIVLIGLIWKN